MGMGKFVLIHCSECKFIQPLSISNLTIANKTVNAYIFFDPPIISTTNYCTNISHVNETSSVQQ